MFRDQGESGDQMLVIAKILNMKDKLLQQILSALLYKKTVIWTDLKINPGASRDNDEIYASEKVVKVRERIDAYLALQNYLPSRINYVPIEPEEVGVYTNIQQDAEGTQGTDFTQLLEAVIDSNADMETLIKDKFLFSQEKIQGFLDTNPVQQTLREQVEELNLHIETLNEQMSANQARLAEADKGENNTQSLQATVDKLRSEVREKDY